MKFFPDYVIQYLMQGINTPDNNKANNKGLFNTCIRLDIIWKHRIWEVSAKNEYQHFIQVQSCGSKIRILYDFHRYYTWTEIWIDKHRSIRSFCMYTTMALYKSSSKIRPNTPNIFWDGDTFGILNVLWLFAIFSDLATTIVLIYFYFYFLNFFCVVVIFHYHALMVCRACAVVWWRWYF